MLRGFGEIVREIFVGEELKMERLMVEEWTAGSKVEIGIGLCMCLDLMCGYLGLRM